jgi:inorganic pyrophosphatase
VLAHPDYRRARRDTRGVTVNLEDLPPFDKESGHANVIVETPKGCRGKYAYDAKLGLFRLKSSLPAGMMFPFDFGFFPGTRAEDGDPLDVLVLGDEPALQGSLVLTRLIAVVEAEQTEKGKTEHNDRLIGVAVSSREYRSVESPDQLSPDLMTEIEHFFISYNQLAGKEFRPVGRAGADRARQLVEAGQK